MTLEVGSTLSGEVLSLSAEGTVVALAEGQIGVAASSPGREGPPLRVGERVAVRVLALGTDGRFEVALLPHEERPADAFDREFHRLKYVLRSRSSRLTAARVVRDRLPEEKTEKWIAQAEEGLARLRRHHSERVEETFYDEETEGRQDAKRDSSRR
jgi:predicted RNA-binding protein with RPS1 domain